MLFSMFVSEVTIWRKGRSCIEYLRYKDEVERAAGWRPELQLASRMRASFQVIIIIITVHQYQTLSVFVFHSVFRQTLVTSTAQFYLISPLRSHLER